MSFEIRKAKRGFAAMSEEQRRKIAKMGGKAAHKAGTAHVWDAATAAEAGRKGGKVSRGGRGKVPAQGS